MEKQKKAVTELEAAKKSRTKTASNAKRASKSQF
jgi:hypothetical protein